MAVEKNPRRLCEQRKPVFSALGTDFSGLVERAKSEDVSLDANMLLRRREAQGLRAPMQPTARWVPQLHPALGGGEVQKGRNNHVSCLDQSVGFGQLLQMAQALEQ